MRTIHPIFAALALSFTILAFGVTVFVPADRAFATAALA